MKLAFVLILFTLMLSSARADSIAKVKRYRDQLAEDAESSGIAAVVLLLLALAAAIWGQLRGTNRITNKTFYYVHAGPSSYLQKTNHTSQGKTT